MRTRLRVDPDRRQTLGEVIYDVAQTQIAEQGLPSQGDRAAGSRTSRRSSCSSSW